MRTVKLVFEFIVITIVMYFIRPLEALFSALWSAISEGYKAFILKFKCKMWYTTNLKPKDYYRVSFEVWRDSK